MDTGSGSHQESSSSSEASGTDYSAITLGAWMGSNVTKYEIDWLYRSRRIPEGVACRLPRNEIEPVPEPGERVVFLAHFERGLGLPVSGFFRSFLDFYELQPHHLPGNAVFYLSCYATFMEAYIGIRPTRETFARFFALRINSAQGKDIPKPKPPVQCGSCIISSRQQSPFFKFYGLESCRLWQGTFFYVKNTGTADLIDLPPFNPAPPTRANWSYNPKEAHIETNRIIRFMKQQMKDTDICSDDIIRAFISRRVLPLKRRQHKMSEMFGPGDPTKITGLPLSKKDVVLKARQICQTAMPEDWEWGLRPLSSTNPPTQEAKDRFPGIESDRRGPCRKRALDKFDPDPVIHWRDLKMGRTPASRLGKSPPEPADLPSANIKPQVHEHVAPLQAEVGQEFLDKLSRARSPGPMPVQAKPLLPNASGLSPLRGSNPALKLGPRPEGSAGPARTSTPPPHSSPALSVPQTSASLWEVLQVRGVRPLHRQITALRRNLPSSPRPKIPAPATSAPKKKLPGGRNLRFLPSRKKRRRKRRIHALLPPRPRRKLPCRQPLRRLTPHRRRRRKPLFLRQPGPRQHLRRKLLPPSLGAPPRRQLKDLRGQANAASGPNSARRTLQGKGALRSAADVSVATRSVGKDRLPIIDPAGPKCTEGHFIRLKSAVREFDNAWHDATSNVVSTADARKQLFEELLWEHRDLSEAHSKCQAIPEASIEALKVKVTALQEEKDKLVLKHQEELSAQRASYQKLKDQLIQLGLDHAQALKAAESAAKARLNEALEDAGNANVVLQAELEEATRSSRGQGRQGT
ncbi:hypothetical protein QYE76_041670 [Lolium multiflorum]|uniref:Transposase (putative) gypsy type domain-containing protein n=1 Tax=Lolium multiflorum TaxID=4521 RepID=A0AAD8WU06_LOLMU|nr:hypothetical protein QYE76_041670 [Lolium multiflorum]